MSVTAEVRMDRIAYSPRERWPSLSHATSTTSRRTRKGRGVLRGGSSEGDKARCCRSFAGCLVRQWDKTEQGDQRATGCQEAAKTGLFLPVLEQKRESHCVHGDDDCSIASGRHRNHAPQRPYPAKTGHIAGSFVERSTIRSGVLSRLAL